MMSEVFNQVVLRCVTHYDKFAMIVTANSAAAFAISTTKKKRPVKPGIAKPDQKQLDKCIEELQNIKVIVHEKKW